MNRRSWVIVMFILALPMMAGAQEEKAEPEGGMLERIYKMAEVITRSEEAREAGMPEEDVKVILEESQKRDLPPEETEKILIETTEAVKESGPVDNFGAFVQTKLDEGLRGRELADAIHEEHRKNGKGKGPGKGHGKGHDKKKKNEHEGHDHDHGDDLDVDEDGDDDDGNGKENNKGNNKGKGK